MSVVCCPHCSQSITDPDALLCLFCGESLERPIGVLGGMRRRWAAWLSMLVLLAFIGVMMW